VRKILRERSRNLNREVWESPSVYGGEDVKVAASIAAGVMAAGQFIPVKSLKTREAQGKLIMIKH
jgi:hypothetical protein